MGRAALAAPHSAEVSGSRDAPGHETRRRDAQLVFKAHIVECAVESERDRAARVAEHSWRVHDGVAVRVYDRTAPRLADAIPFGLDVEQIVRASFENPKQAQVIAELNIGQPFCVVIPDEISSALMHFVLAVAMQ